MILLEGRFSDGWLSEYSQAFAQAMESWKQKPDLPKKVAAAVHAMSVYPMLRYEAWRKISHERSNDHTETEIARLRTESERFLLGGLA